MSLWLVALGWALFGMPHSAPAAEVLVAPQDDTLARFLTAIAEGDLGLGENWLIAQPQLARRSFQLCLVWDSSSDGLFRVARPGEVFRGTRTTTALHFAVELNRPLTTGLLLQHGADPLALSSDDQSPLEAAITGYSSPEACAEMVRLLLFRHADPNRKNRQGLRPLHLACVSGRTRSAELLRILVNNGADVNAETLEGESPLILLARQAGDDAFVREAMAVLVEHGADVNHRDQRGRTALMRLVEWPEPVPRESVANLLAHHADLNLRDEGGRDVLQHALADPATGGSGSGALGAGALALYPFYSHWAGEWQMLALLVVLVGVTIAVWARNRRLKPLTESTWAARLRLPPQWPGRLSSGRSALVPKMLDRRLEWDRRLSWTLLPFAALATVMLMLVMDTILMHTGLAWVVLIYAGGYGLAYGVVWMRHRWLTPTLLAAGAVYSLAGLVLVGLQGLVYWVGLGEETIAALYFGCAVGLGGQAGLMGYLAVTGWRSAWFDRQAQIQCQVPALAPEHTEVEDRAGWDEGRRGGEK